MFKVATWNVNSLRVRLPHVLEWLASTSPDVLAIQETKLVDPDFPCTDIAQAGYAVVYSGQKTYNGMAVLSRQQGLNIITDIVGLDDSQRRILAVTIGDIRVVNLYVPNGQSVDSDKYQYKLAWLQKVTTFLKHEMKVYPKLIVLGDFNIAPTESDVCDPQAWEGKVLFSGPERTAFRELVALGLRDCFRLQQQTEKSFTWWDYRMNAYKRNLGLRIDHILSTESLALQCTQCYIDKTPRGWERPSDHAPVVAEFVT